MVDLSKFVNGKFLSKDEEKDLICKAQQGDRTAMGKIIVSYMPFVVKTVKKYKGYGLDKDDLIAEGVAGLHHAISVFDSSYGSRLMTYAVYWIKHRVREFIVKNWSVVSTGSHRLRRLGVFKLRSVISKASHLLDEDEQKEFICKEMGLDWDQIQEIINSTIYDYSMDAPLKSNSEDTDITDWYNITRDESADIEADSIRLSDSILVHRAKDVLWNNLDKREKSIVNDRILSSDPQSLQELASVWGVSKERIRQIEKVIYKRFEKQILSMIPSSDPMRNNIKDSIKMYA